MNDEKFDREIAELKEKLNDMMKLLHGKVEED
jgi:hypothetical protein